MSGFVAAATVVGVSSFAGAREGRIARKDASAKADIARAEEKERKEKLDAELAAEKKAANLRLKTRMSRTGTAGTIAGGAARTPTLLGSVAT